MGIAYCLAEIGPAPQGDRRLAGLDHCPSPGHAGEGGVLPWVEIFDFAGRTWSLSFVPEPGYPPLRRGWESWTLIAIGLLSTGLLGTFLLVTSGRTRRIESLVSQRTAELADASARLIAKQAILTHAERIARLGSWETQPATGKTYWSAELFHILGVPPDQAAGVDRLLAAIHPDDRETLRAALNTVGNGGAATSVDVRLPERDGSSPIVHVSIEATRGADGVETSAAPCRTSPSGGPQKPTSITSPTTTP
jgi:PAS domain-containing protein